MQYTPEIEKKQETPPDVLPTKQFFIDGIYLSIGKGLSFLASFAVVTVIANTLPRETAGMYTYLVAVVAILSIATLPGANQATMRSVAQGFLGTAGMLIKKRIAWGWYGSIIAVLFGILKIILGDTIIGIACIIIAPFVALTDTYSNTTFSFWKGIKRFDTSALYHTLYYVLLAVGSIPIFFLSKNIFVITLWIFTLQTVIGWAVYQPIKKYRDQPSDPESVTLAKHLTLMQGFKTIASNIDRIIAYAFAGPTAVAIYTFAITPIQKATQLVPIGTVALPYLSHHEFTEKIKRAILKKTYFLFTLTIPLTIAAYFLAPFVYGLLFPKYPESLPLFQFLILNIVFLPTMLLKSSLIAFNKTKTLYGIEIGIPLLKIALMIGLSLFFGIWGIVIGIVIATFFDALISWLFFVRLPTSS